MLRSPNKGVKEEPEKQKKGEEIYHNFNASREGREYKKGDGRFGTLSYEKLVDVIN